MKFAAKTTARVSAACVFGILIFAGCESYRETARGFVRATGGITIRDIHQAQAYRKVLPEHLRLSTKQISVAPGSGVTHVTIYGVKSELERERLAKELTTLNLKNPQLNPLKWTFY